MAVNSHLMLGSMASTSGSKAAISSAVIRKLNDQVSHQVEITNRGGTPQNTLMLFNRHDTVPAPAHSLHQPEVAEHRLV